MTITRQVSDPDTRIEILSKTGQKIPQLNVDLNIIDTRGLNPGIYFIRMQEKQKIYLGTFVKTE